MKKIAFLMLAVLLSGATLSYAAETSTYDEMKAIKAKQRAERASHKAAVQSGAVEPSKLQKFWKNEGERSGLGQSGNGIGAFLKGLNPAPFLQHQQEAYNARKASGGAK